MSSLSLSPSVSPSYTHACTPHTHTHTHTYTYTHRDSLSNIGILQSQKTMELRSKCLFWNNIGCGWPVRGRNDSPCGRGHRQSLTLVYLHGLQPFFSFSFLRAAAWASLRSWRDLSAQPVSRLTIWGLLLPSCSGQCSRLLGPSCTHLWIAAMVCLWDVFPAQVLRRGGLWVPSVVHAHNVAKPVHMSLFQQRQHAGASSSFQDSVVWDLGLPGGVQNASEARACNVQDSLPYRRVLTTQAL